MTMDERTKNLRILDLSENFKRKQNQAIQNRDYYAQIV